MKTIIINNRYKLIKQLGKGGFGEAYLAEDLTIREKVVVKLGLGKGEDEIGKSL